MKNRSLFMAVLTAVLIVALTFSGRQALCVQPLEQGDIPNAEVMSGGVTPVEDLMREHGVLRRVMLIYDEELSHMRQGKDPHYGIIFKAASIIHDFIEAYHEKLEEDYIFPIFEKAGELTDLTRILRQQHEAGRRLTLEILYFSRAGRTGDKEKPDALADDLRSFNRMYRPHAAREDTVLFAALRSLVSEKKYDEMGDKFEDKEQELFGKNGFEGKVDEVSGLEKELGIYDLSHFTPRK
jgi:hemerythrin-like domain-containing protein